MVQILYKQVLNLEIWHDFFLGQLALTEPFPVGYGLSAVLTIAPTAECLQTLKNLRWVFRARPTGGLLFAQVEPVVPGDAASGYHTQIPVTRPERLTFWVQVHDRAFANFTNLPLEGDRHSIYYFSNLTNNIQTIGETPHLFLSQPLSAYAANTEYALGQLVVQGANTLEAIQYQSSAAATPADSDWEVLPLSQYVSGGDRISRQDLFHTPSLIGVIPGETVRVTLVDVNEQTTFEQEITIPESHLVGDPFVASLQLSGQKPGHYRLFQNGTEIDRFVLCDPLLSQNAFALIEIVLNPTVVSSDFALLQVSDRQTLIQPRTYRIRFKNRVTRWRYRYERSHGFDAANPIADAFVVINPTTYATRRPLGLRQQPESLPLNNGRRNVPFPTAALIKPVLNGDRHVTDVFSDIHL